MVLLGAWLSSGPNSRERTTLFIGMTFPLRLGRITVPRTRHPIGTTKPVKRRVPGPRSRVIAPSCMLNARYLAEDSACGSRYSDPIGYKRHSQCIQMPCRSVRVAILVTNPKRKGPCI
jgi:hypothetical protein